MMVCIPASTLELLDQQKKNLGFADAAGIFKPVHD